MPFSSVVLDRERDKFLENPAGETSVRVFVSNESGDAIPVTGSFGSSVATGPLKRTIYTVTSAAANPLPTPLDNRIALIIRNKSAVDTVYFGENGTVTADDTSTGGWEIGPGEEFGFDMDDTNGFFLISESGKTPTVKILELASTGSGSAPVAGTRLHETPSGSIDNSNTTFTLTQTPLSSAEFSLYLDGLLLRVTTHYTRTGTTVTMVTAPNFGQELDAIYRY